MKLKLILFILAISLIFSSCGTVIPNPNPQTQNNNVTSNGDAIQVALIGNNGKLLKTNERSLVSLSSIHYHNHVGDIFVYNEDFILNAAQVHLDLWCIGSEKNAHFTSFEVTVGGNPILIEFFENPTITNNGTAKNLSNTNRQFNFNSSINVYDDPTITNDGKLLIRRGIIAAQSKIAGVAGSETEWILARDTCYLFKVTNQNGNNVQFYNTFFWYEERIG